MSGRLSDVSYSYRHNAGALQGAPHGGQTIDLIAGVRDQLYGGNCYIAGEGEGIVTVDGNPAQRVVRLFDRENGHFIRQTMSAPDGSYRFDYLRGDRTYQVIGIDHTNVENAVIVDLVQAVPMP